MAKHMGEVLAEMRAARKMSQQRLAFEIGVSAGMIGNVERGVSRLSEDRTALVGLALELTEEEFQRLEKARKSMVPAKSKLEVRLDELEVRLSEIEGRTQDLVDQLASGAKAKRSRKSAADTAAERWAATSGNVGEVSEDRGPGRGTSEGPADPGEGEQP